MANKTSYTVPFIIVTSLFFLWGFLTVLVDSLIPRLREIFELSYFQAGLVQFAFFGAYFLLSIPAGQILSRIGYKRGIVLGLGVMAMACLLFYPASSMRMFGLFMLAYFMLAAGMTILQVAANPYVAVLGSEGKSSSRLNLAQAFNSLGTAIAPAVGAAYLLRDKIFSSAEIDAMSVVDRDAYYISEAQAVQKPFLVLAMIVAALALFFVFVRLPKLIEKAPTGGYAKLLKRPAVLAGVLGIFVYVGAEVAIGSYLVNYFMDLGVTDNILQNETMSGLAKRLLGSDLSGVDPKAIAGAFVVFYWSGAMIGRFIGSALTYIFKPGLILGIFGSLAITLIFVSMNSTGFTAMWSILAVGLFNSIMFPTIFTLTLEGQGDLKPQTSGLLCTAIVGGAIIPPLYGYLTDQFGFQMALILVVLCYLYIAVFGYSKLMRKPTVQLE